MPYQVSLADELRKAGVNVREHAGWKTRGSSGFNPRGVVVHHTGPGGTDALIRLCIDGRPDLPGPLAEVVLAPDGTANVIAGGTANHAGPGGWRGLSGNSSVWGIEAIHPGNNTTPWPAVQLAAYYKICAVMLKICGAEVEMVCGHKEWAPTRKTDPAQLNMDQFRIAVGVELAKLTTPIEETPVAITLTRAQGGYIVVQTQDGGVFAYENAPFYGSRPGSGAAGKTVSAAWTPSGFGYWLLSEEGNVYAYGDAQFKGVWLDLDAATRGNRVPVGITPAGNGYKIIAKDIDSSPFDAYGFGI